MSIESPDMGLVKECLQGVGLYEESMGKDDMIQYYNVIKSSESTATEESKRRQHNNNSTEMENLDSSLSLVDVSPEINTRKNAKRTFTPKTWSTTKRQLDVNTASTSSSNNNTESLTFEEIRNSLNTIDIYKYKIDGRKKIEVAQVPNHYGPYYCHKSFDNLSIHERVKRILLHHSALAKTYYKLQRSSVNLAKLGNAVCQIGKFNGDLERNNSKTDSDEMDDLESPSPEVYTSRGGRSIKRKMYAEEIQSDEESETEKKKSKADNSKSVKKTNVKKLTNEEIMNRSSLFSDSPKIPKTRSEKLFDQLQADEPKRKKSDQEKDKFEASLDDLSDDFEIKITSSQCLVPSVAAPETAVSGEAESTNFTKLKVVHPLMGRKGYRRNQMLVPVTETITKPVNESRSSPLAKTLDDAIEIKKTTPNKGPKKKQNCPICNQSFFQKDIENHASTCGLTSELEIENNLPTQDSTLMTCEICDTTFHLTTGYEVHVKECIEKHKNT